MLGLFSFASLCFTYNEELFYKFQLRLNDIPNLLAEYKELLSSTSIS